MKAPLISTILASAALALPSFAGSSSTTAFDFEVTVDRSALKTDASISSEYERIHKQVSQRCKSENAGYNPIRRTIAVRGCINTAMSDVIRKVDHAGLTAYHRAYKNS